ncbi:Innexin unc-9 [Schistosoma japonicum]|nr:Innexin unc-9 [Schistosoma japonicum]
MTLLVITDNVSSIVMILPKCGVYKSIFNMPSVNYLRITINARQYIGKPIACWVPTEFTRAQEEYAESVCWVTSTYFIPTQEVNVPENISERENRKIHYYQWVPFILMIQAFMFNLPCLIWRLFNWQSGIHMKQLHKVNVGNPYINAVPMLFSSVNLLTKDFNNFIGYCTYGCNSTYRNEVSSRLLLAIEYDFQNKAIDEVLLLC